MAVTSFAKAIDNIVTKVSTGYTAGSGKLHVVSTKGITLNGSQWIRVSVSRSGNPLSILKATSVGLDAYGAYLTIAGTADGYTDVNLNSGDSAELRVTAGAFNELSTAINNLESGSSAVAKIGNSVVNGTSNSVLYVNGDGTLADSGPTWDGQSFSFSYGLKFYDGYPWYGHHFTWIDLPAAPNQPCGIGTGGVGNNYFLGYCDTAGSVFNDSNVGDLAFRDNGYRLLFGTQSWPYSQVRIANTGVTIASISAWHSVAIIQGASGQTGDLTQWQDSGNNVLSKVDSNGYHVMKVKTTSGTPADTPSDGAIIINTNESRIYVRTGNAWKSVVVS